MTYIPDKPILSHKRAWAAYRADYRAQELKRLTGWIAAGVSGTVVGLPGCGRSNLLSFMCHRPEIFNDYLPSTTRTVVVLIDMHDILETDLSTFYRIVLRSIYRVREYCEPEIQELITTIYQDTYREEDVFLTQSALQGLLLALQAGQMRLVLVLNHFDHFTEIATVQMANALRSLRDGFKDMLSYIVGMAQEVAYLPDPDILGYMYDLLDSHICWVGAMSEPDATDLIMRATAAATIKPNVDDIATMINLTGGFPSLLKAACFWWSEQGRLMPRQQWAKQLMAERSVQHRLKQIWTGLTQEEQRVASQLQGSKAGKKRSQDKGAQQAIGQPKASDAVLQQLLIKGICRQTGKKWTIAGELLAQFSVQAGSEGGGRIWLDVDTNEIYQDHQPVTGLTALESDVLRFLIQQPRIQHTKTELIFNTWPEELAVDGVSDNSLQQVISKIRKAIEPTSSHPRYLINWRGKPEGGYQFFPEGKPGIE